MADRTLVIGCRDEDHALAMLSLVRLHGAGGVVGWEISPRKGTVGWPFYPVMQEGEGYQLVLVVTEQLSDELLARGVFSLSGFEEPRLED
jgi:hypothetical protein